MPQVKCFPFKHLGARLECPRQAPWSLSGRPLAYRVIVVQFVIGLVLSVAASTLGTAALVSVLLGGMCCLLPNAYFVWKAFRFSGASEAKRVIRSFYYGEIGKWILTISMFMLVFTCVKDLKPVFLFGAFIMVQMVNWATPLLLNR